MSIENHMVIGPYYYEGRDWEPQSCAICKGEDSPLKDTNHGMVCDACRTLCPGCDDWLCAEPTIEHKGAQWHIGCALEDCDIAHPVEISITPAQCIALAKYSDKIEGAA